MAGAAVVGSAGLGMARAPIRTGDTAQPQFGALSDGAAFQDTAEVIRAAVAPLPVPTPNVVVEAASDNAALPSAPDAPLAIRDYVVEAGDS
ncbi:MAG: hypothetical protein LC797_24680, partial [Chloroflexi bacterium]|nr:hypothetical protein [Chloroflexota bacterium]